MTKRRRLRVALLGEGSQTERWAAVLRGVAEIVPWPPNLPVDIDALVLTRGSGDPFGRAREALLADVPVLYAAPFLLSPWQAGTLTEAARRQRRLLRFAEPLCHQRGFAFLRRLLAGDEPFWRPLYIRSLHLARPSGPTRIDELATEDLAICDALLGGTPHWAAMAVSRHDEVGDVRAAFLTVGYGNGRIAHCTLSLAEATNARQLVVAMPDRTVVLDDQDALSQVRIVGSTEHDLLSDGAGGASAPRLDPLAEEATRFLTGVEEDDLSPANGDRWTRVAGLWWAARQSMSAGGPIRVPRPVPGAGSRGPPPLRVIQGGGRSAPTAQQRPPLTLIAG